LAINATLCSQDSIDLLQPSENVTIETTHRCKRERAMYEEGDHYIPIRGKREGRSEYL
jgi:hypothetical protein